ncbi:Fis family transcriptional regulator, factor for inversion stimulation protein [Methylomagnum ishizawai]|uniref:Putative Fis-like DNA-binding protein n=1 Tax=Methylomagnum ishizawai TaxID=1760988 RepID=A0A1Y6CZL2_9GAMM|nr:helix-turn-helix domain-containing protein [Methylomagnum ishizawai]SMF93584.1 Fis family transcriptional regulator, factor for inversion stimulation protein [Methylomagnum ishizawai]
MTVDPANIPPAPDAAIPPGPGTAPILSEQVRLALRHYFAGLDGHAATGLYAMVISEVEKPLIETVLEHCGHNQSRAAQVLGLSRSTLRKKMNQYGIE